MPAVSVIVPIYGVEKYVEKCVRSLFSQTLEDVEYIFVNDGTPDASMSVLRSVLNEYPLRSPFVKIVDKTRNEGLPAARRTGLDHATGDYIIHCDSDDWVEPDYLAEMYAAARAYDADGVVCGYMEEDRPVPTMFTAQGLDCKDSIFKSLIAAKEMVSVWRFLFKSELYSGLMAFPEESQGEDHAIVVQLACSAHNIYCVNEPLYHWRVNMDSITRDPSPEGVRRRFVGACANAGLVESFLEKEGLLEKYRDEVAALKLCSMFYLRPLLRLGEDIDAFRGAFPEIKGHILTNKEISFVHKIEYLAARYCPVSVIKTLYRWKKSSR